MKESELSQNSIAILQAVSGLPLYIGYDTNLIESYVTERRAIQTAKQLKAFTKHWNSIWKVPWSNNWFQTRTEKQLVSGRYDAGIALRCINKNGPNGSGCAHIKSNKLCVSVAIMTPDFLMRVLELKERFVVPEGIIILQLLRGLNQGLRDKDPDDIFAYVNKHRPVIKEYGLG